MKLDLTANLLTGATAAVLEMGGAFAKRGFNATDTEVALLTSAQSLGLICSVVVASLAHRLPKMPLVFWPEILRSVALMLVFFVHPTVVIAFIVFHGAAQMFQSVTIPARVTIYRLNYPTSLRARIVARNRQALILVTTCTTLILSAGLEWSLGMPALTGLLGDCPLDAPKMLNYGIPILGLVGMCGALAFRRIRVREPDAETNTNGVDSSGAGSPTPLNRGGKFANFLRVWRENPHFRAYEYYFMIFGAANIMTVPLLQIHAVDELGANYVDLAFINVVLVQGMMIWSTGFWGKFVDRHPPARLRGLLNMIFAADLVILALAPTIWWVYGGRLLRGFAIGGGALIWMLGSLYYARDSRDAPIYLGIHTALTGVRWAFAPFLGVGLKALFGDARPVFLVAAVTVILAGFGLMRHARHQPQPQATDAMPAPRTPGA